MAARKKNTKAVSNEEIIAALLQCGTVKEAATIAGTTPRTIYERMNNDYEFRGEYAEAKNSLVRKAVFSINERLAEAIDAVSDIMKDKKVNAAVRLQAAQTIINNATKFAERLNKDENHARSEGTNPKDVWERIGI